MPDINDLYRKGKIMLKQKIFSLIFLALFSTVVLSGCYPTGNRLPVKNGSSDQLTGSDPIIKDDTKIEVERGELRANIYNLPTDYPSEIPVIDLSFREWDIKELERLFIGNNTITEYYEFESDLSPNITRYVYIVDDGDGNDFWLVYEPGRFEIDDRTDHADEVSSLMSVCDYLCMDKVFNDGDLAAFPKSDAVERVNKVLEDVGLTNVSEPEIWSVTAEKANELFAKYFGEDAPFWTEKDEVYILSYSLLYNNIPIITEEKAIPALRNKSFRGSKVTAIVSKNRILSFRCSKIFSEDQSSDSKVSVNYSPAEAFETLIPVYENIKLGYTLDFYKCKLVYMAVNRKDRLNYSFAPAWQFDYSYEDSLDGTITQNFELVSADKGIRIVNPEG